MGLVIREMCPGDRQEVQALLAAAKSDQPGSEGQPQAAEKIVQQGSVMGLVACEEGKIVAAMICNKDGQSGYLCQLSEAQSQPRGDIAKALINKTMLKLNARGVGKFRVDQPVTGSQPSFWDEVKWGDAGAPDQSDQATEQREEPLPGSEAEPELEPEADVETQPDVEVGPVTQAG